jgi:uncharacterized protein (DUF2147 family)
MTVLFGLFFVSAAFAQSSPVGLWRSIDDKSGEPKAEIRISEAGGALSGRIEKRLARTPSPMPSAKNARTSARASRSRGLEILRGLKKAEGKDVWGDGKILDPENGREYTARATPIEGGKRLEVRGSFGPFGRTQTWVRVQ